MDFNTILGKIQTKLTFKQLPSQGDVEVSYLFQNKSPTRQYNSHIICLGSVLNFLGEVQPCNTDWPPLSPVTNIAQIISSD